MGVEPQGRSGGRTRSSHCAMCGWPCGPEPRCGICGADGALPLADAPRMPEPREAPDAAAAWQAWHTESWARLVQHAIEMVDGRHVVAVQSAGVHGWSFVAPNGAPVFAMLSQAQAGTPGLVAVEAPVARLPERHRVPAMRVALELAHREEVRACLRDDLVLVRVARRLSVATPLVLTQALARVAELAERWADRLTADFDARAATERADRPSWDVVGRPRTIAALAFGAAHPPRAVPAGNAAAASSIQRPQAPPTLTAPRSAGAPPSAAKPPARPDATATAPSVGIRPREQDVRGAKREPEPLSLDPSSAVGSRRLAPPREPAAPPDPPAPRGAGRPESLPAILSPFFVGGGEPAAAPTGQGPGGSVDPGGGVERDEPRPPLQTIRDLTIDSGPRPISVPPPPPPTGTRPEDKLCDMLRYAQTLATALSFEERPATMMLLIRATVFRAVLEYRATVPDAVAHLYKSARGVLREIWTSSPGVRRRSSMQVPVAEPLLLVMEQIVAHGARVPQETPLAIDPLMSAGEVRAHLARYVDEIENAPSDPPLRHFLALGALAELLVRTRLPSSTEQRLLEIVTHGQRDSGRSASAELMMRALQKIVAG